MGGACHRVDQASGKTLGVYNIPDQLIRPRAKSTPSDADLMDIEWPCVWRVVGPFPRGIPPLPQEALKKLPERVTVKGKSYAATTVEAVDNILDFAKHFPASKDRVAYAFARIKCPITGRLAMGASARGAMELYVDGKPVKPARTQPVYPFARARDLFTADVSAGEHVVAVKVTGDGRGWRLVSASSARLLPMPRDLKNMAWGYVSVAGDVLLGSYVGPVTDHEAYWASRSARLSYRTLTAESKAVFALEKKRGLPLWIYRARGTIPNNSIAFGDGKLFIVDGTSMAETDRAKRRGKKIKIKQELLALDLATGAELWRRPRAARRNVQYSNGIVLIGGGQAFDAATGKPRVSVSSRGSRAIIHGDWVITTPYKYGYPGYAADIRTGARVTASDILTGEKQPWKTIRACGCGPMVGCRGLLFLRSGAFGFFDLDAGGMANFGEAKPGCGVSMIAANGLVILPEASSGCACSYNYQTSLALVPAADRGRHWYVFPGLATSGKIKHIRLNLGAPGDRRDANGAAWLGLPRPWVRETCPAPVAVVMEKPEWYSRSPERAPVKNTNAPWIYASGLRGEGKIGIDLVLQRPIAVHTCDQPPTIDGELDDACWKGAEPVRFAGNGHRSEPAAILFIRRHAGNLYFGYRRKAVVRNGKPVPFVAKQTGKDAKCWKDDDFEIFLADNKLRYGLYAGVSCSGARFDSLSVILKQWRSKFSWDGKWRHAVKKNAHEWRAEIAIPMQTLKQAKLDVNNLRVNCMSQNLSGYGPKRIFLTDPVLDFGRCQKFLPTVDKRAVVPKDRTFNVRLHFAETDNVSAGRRVFDVALQGKTALRNFDVVREAGARNVALVKEFKGIRAGDLMMIELTAKGKGREAGTEPFVNGIEVVEERNER